MGDAARVVLVGLVALGLHRLARVKRLQADHSEAPLLHLAMQPGRHGAGFVADLAQAGAPRLQRLGQRVGIGRQFALEGDLPLGVDDANRSKVRSDVKSGKILHGCPPSFRARQRPGFVDGDIMGDSRLLRNSASNRR